MNLTNLNLLINGYLIVREKKNIRFIGPDSEFDKKMDKNHDFERYLLKAEKSVNRLVVCIL